MGGGWQISLTVSPFLSGHCPAVRLLVGKGDRSPSVLGWGWGPPHMEIISKTTTNSVLRSFLDLCFFFSTAHSFLDRMPNVLAWKGGYPLLLPGASFRFCSQIAPCCLCAHVCVHKCVCSPTDFLCPLLFFYQLPVLLLITLPAWGLRSARCFLQLKASQGTIFGGRNFWGPSKDS